MNYIYLIGTEGAARTSDEDMARALEYYGHYHRCTQKEYIQRMRKMKALDTPADPDTCPDCGTPMDWEDCDVCGGKGYIDAYDLDPLWYDPGDVEMCNQCLGTGGWYTCGCSHIYPTEKDRTASDPASAPPAGTPAAPLAGCQQARQREEAL